MVYEQGRHPNSLKNLERHTWKPGESGNPDGRPPGTGLIMMKPLIRVIDEQQSTIDGLKKQMSEYSKKLSETEDELENALARIVELEDETENEDTESHFSEVCEKCSKDIHEQQMIYERIKEQLYKENEELKAKVKALEKELNTKNQRIEILLAELKPYRKDRLQEAREKIELENAGYARR